MSQHWNIEPATIDDLTEKQLAEISSRFKFELEGSETVSITIRPPVFLVAPYVAVDIGNVKSEAEFLSRFHGVVLNSYSDERPPDADSYFGIRDVEIFQFDKKPGGYFSQLSFNERNGKVNAALLIIGNVPELGDVYKMAPFDYREILLSSKLQWIPPLVAATLLLFLIGVKRGINRKARPC